MSRPDVAAPIELPSIGDTVADKYVLRAVLGAGGMGVVFEADQLALGRRVAIKMISPAMASEPTIASRLRSEGRAAGRLSHPNIAAILDVGETPDGLPFLVMELVHGPNLSRLLSTDGPLAPRRAAELVAQILAALDDAHAAGLVHGDIKSDNVLVETSRDGLERIKIIDFGLARLARDGADDAHPRRTDVVSGTPEYIAPELIRGEAPSPSSDLYAAGVILYELLTGETPFADGSSAEILARHLAEPVVPPSLRRPDGALPPAFDLVALRALAKEPRARFASARAFAAALEAAAHKIAAAADAGAAAHAHPNGAVAFERTTERWDGPPQVASPLEREQAARALLARALERGLADDIVTGYLALSRALVSGDRLGDAVRELEEAVMLLAGDHAPVSLWKLLIALASLYEASGTPGDAARAAARGYAHAAARNSALGRRRARAMIEHLARAASA